jgi:hypothetical protein
MSTRNSNHNKLIENDFHALKEYNQKKEVVLLLLGKILYGVIILTILGYGIYLLHISKGEELSKEMNEFNYRSEVAI